MPDWRKKEDYDFISNLSDEGLAWEFVRRNSDYIADWKAYENTLKSTAHSIKPKFLSKDIGKVIGFHYIPPILDHESEVAWSVRVNDPIRLNERQWLCRKWGLRKELKDPSDNSPPEFIPAKSLPSRLTWDELPSYFTNDEETFPPVEKKAVIGFDLESPFGPQLEMAKEILEYAAKTNPSNPGQGDNTKLLPTYIRIIDVPKDVLPKEIAQYFLELKKVVNSDDPNALSKKLYSWRKRAKQLTENYKTFL